MSGSGFVIAECNTWVDNGTSDTGTATATISFNGTVVARASSRISTAISDAVGAFVSYPKSVSNGDTFLLEEYHSKNGYKHARRRFICYGCTVTKQ